MPHPHRERRGGSQDRYRDRDRDGGGLHHKRKPDQHSSPERHYNKKHGDNHHSRRDPHRSGRGQDFGRPTQRAEQQFFVSADSINSYKDNPLDFCEKIAKTYRHDLNEHLNKLQYSLILLWGQLDPSSRNRNCGIAIDQNVVLFATTVFNAFHQLIFPKEDEQRVLQTAVPNNEKKRIFPLYIAIALHRLGKIIQQANNVRKLPDARRAQLCASLTPLLDQLAANQYTQPQNIANALYGIAHIAQAGQLKK